ncbi:HAD family phosphatase [Lachnospiraceae bacterium KGMB03038]|nr:HAD family phosphatase [Lachnospiraceae bacterium KGMB03038]
MLENVDAVIFDMDGTLIDSMWIWPDIDQVYLERYDLTQPEDFHQAMEGMSYREVAQYFLDTFPSLPRTREEIMEDWTQMAYERYMTQVPLKTGAGEFIQRMRKMGKKIGIATSNGRRLVDDTLEALKITELFDSVRTACEVASGKPAPDVYLLVAKDMGVAPERCLVFEDVPMGILAGKNAGMKVCAVEDDFSKPQEKKKRELADYYIQDYEDIINETYEVLK